MTIGILLFGKPGTDRVLPETERLEQAARERGHTTQRLYVNHFTLLPGTHGVEARYDGAPFVSPDVVIARPSSSEDPGTHAALLDLLTQAGCRIVNNVGQLERVKNKIRQKMCLDAAGVPTPRWSIARGGDQAADAARTLNYPLVVKMPHGSRGSGVLFAPDAKALRPLVDFTTHRRATPVYLEEFVAEANCQDLRIFVVDGKECASMRRVAPPDEIRANAAVGGTGERVEITQEELDLALRAAKVFDLDIAGVDIIRSSRGPLVLEVNSNPGFEELESATGVDVAGAIIAFATRRAGANI